MMRPDADPVAFLVCGRRWLHGPPDIRQAPDGAQMWDWFVHPVAIEFIGRVAVRYGVKDGGCVWQRSLPVESFGMTTITAKAALDDAFRGIKGSAMIDIRALTYRMTWSPKAIMHAKGGALMRNIVAWVFWQEWNNQGLTMDQRAAKLTEMDFPCTAKALKRAAEERGL
jgi:hypothetical protein